MYIVLAHLVVFIRARMHQFISDLCEMFAHSEFLLTEENDSNKWEKNLCDPKKGKNKLTIRFHFGSHDDNFCSIIEHSKIKIFSLINKAEN